MKKNNKPTNQTTHNQVEPALRQPVPREMVWTTREFSHEVIDEEPCALLIHGSAVRAVVKEAKWESDREGPDNLRPPLPLSTKQSPIRANLGLPMTFVTWPWDFPSIRPGGIAIWLRAVYYGPVSS